MKKENIGIKIDKNLQLKIDVGIEKLCYRMLGSYTTVSVPFTLSQRPT